MGRPRWAAANDDRTTRVGRFIRKLRIDELPQIFNVFKGEMSFVGPRPERPFFVDQLAKQIPFYALRHSVKARDHRLGASALPVRRFGRRSRGETSVRSVLREEQQPVPRHHDPDRYGGGRVVGKGIQ